MIAQLDMLTLLLVYGLVVVLCGTGFIVSVALRRNDIVGRYWSVAFIAGILATIGNTIWAMAPSEGWSVALANGAIVMTLGAMWAGARLYNDRGSWIIVPAVLALASAVCVALDGWGGPDGWGGGIVMLASVAGLSIAAGVESLRGALGANLYGKVLAATLLVVGSYFSGRALVFAAWGPDSALFTAYFGTAATTLMATLLVILGAMSMAVLRAEQPNVVTRHDGGPFENGVLGRIAFRNGAEDRLRRCRQHGVGVSLLRVGVDRLAEVNTVLGRSESDRIIANLGDSLRASVPPTAVIGYGGSGQFLVLAVQEQGTTVAAIAERIMSTVAETPRNSAAELRMSVSVGAVVAPADGPDIDTLIEASSSALARASRSGGNQYVVVELDRSVTVSGTALSG